MRYVLNLVASYSILLPAMIALLQFRKIAREYYPFVILLWAGLINEIVSTIASHQTGSNAINSNIYVLIESLLIVWQFYLWRKLLTKPAVYTIAAALILIWLGDNLLFGKLNRFSSVFRITYALMCASLAAYAIARSINLPGIRASQNPVFLISCAFIVYYMYKALVELFWLRDMGNSREFMRNAYFVFDIMNLSLNLFSAYILRWTRTKPRYL